MEESGQAGELLMLAAQIVHPCVRIELPTCYLNSLEIKPDEFISTKVLEDMNRQKKMNPKLEVHHSHHTYRSIQSFS